MTDRTPFSDNGTEAVRGTIRLCGRTVAHGLVAAGPFAAVVIGGSLTDPGSAGGHGMVQCADGVVDPVVRMP
jgi:hypothetical protein